jgi:hypothetical protein
MTTSRIYRIVFVVCHPDDEAIWVGGLLYELSRFQNMRVYVICLSGRDPNSPREREFDRARREANYAGGIVMGFPLRPAGHPLPNTAETVVDGLKVLGLAEDDVDLLITHPCYGDEFCHPHHKQANGELKAWTAKSNIPFGYFSCLPVPFFHHTPLMNEVHRGGSGTFHLIQLSRCSHALSRQERDATVTPVMFRGGTLPMFEDCPRYYIQFAADAAAKARIVGSYVSVDIPAHTRNYTMLTNPCEAVYLMDKRGLEPFDSVLEQMKVPVALELFRSSEPLPIPPTPVADGWDKSAAELIRELAFRGARKLKRVSRKLIQRSQ